MSGWRNPQAALDYLLAEYAPNADARMMQRIHAAWAEAGLVECAPRDRTPELVQWANDLERRKQQEDGCQGLTRKGTKCRARVWPYCDVHLFRDTPTQGA